jgi:NAD+ kinase
MPLAQLGLVVHPRRDLEGALEISREWAAAHGVAVGQVRIAGQTRQVGEPVDAAACDLVVSLGGDGTTLAALHAAAPVSRPVLGVACGSIGVLTSVFAKDLGSALDQVGSGDWTPRALPGLEIALGDAGSRVAINDFVAIRKGAGQVITSITVDSDLYARTAGDGVVVSTPLGSTAYTMAAGGPILGPGAKGIVVMPLATHGGESPPLVVGPESRVELMVEPGYGGSRFEIDGQELPETARSVTISERPDFATLVTLADQEPLFTNLRRRGLVTDSPRVLIRDARAGAPRR